MTLIVGIETDRGAWIGADSWIGDGESTGRVRKIFKIGLAHVGFAGTWSAVQAIAERLGLSRHPMREPVGAWLRARFKAARAGVEDDDVDSLVVIGGEVWTIDEHLVASQSLLGVGAVGSGAAGALHALAATEGMPPRKRMLRTLGAAALYSDGVAEPFDVHYVGAT